MITCSAYNRRLRDLTAFGILVFVMGTASIVLIPGDAPRTVNTVEQADAKGARPNPPGQSKSEKEKSAARESVAADGIFSPVA